MKNIVTLILFVPIIGFSCRSTTNQEQVNTAPIQQLEKDTLTQVVKKKEVSSEKSTKETTLEVPLDTLITPVGNGDSLFTYIYKYHDTIPGRPVRKFVIKNQNDSIIFKSFDEDFYFDGFYSDEEDFTVMLFPLYDLNRMVDETVSLKIEFNFLVKSENFSLDRSFGEYVIFPQNGENNLLAVATIKFKADEFVVSRELQVKNCDIDSSDLTKIYERVTSSNYEYLNDEKDDLLNLFVCSLDKIGLDDSLNLVFLREMEYSPNDPSSVPFYLTQYIYSSFVFMTITE
ncbi:hypothetical protein [Reichenbachiella agariperforans]|uniref:hypothetical protein n=1 Tax=Reichenbachiella agariperforans TaxID=156994 RepID=UPI001C095BAA|nr:hypothetical protein [Reichenbachiella agariperforans]